MRLDQIIRKPLVTEKSNVGREERSEVTFAVDPRANKHDIARAVQTPEILAQLFNVPLVYQ